MTFAVAAEFRGPNSIRTRSPASSRNHSVASSKQASPLFRRIFGWSEQVVLGHPYPLVPEEKQDEFRMNLERSLRGEALTTLETRRQRKDGGHRILRGAHVTLGDCVPFTSHNYINSA